MLRRESVLSKYKTWIKSLENRWCWEQSFNMPRDPHTGRLSLTVNSSTSWSLTHLCLRDFWSPPCGLEPFGPAPSVSPPFSPSPSGPSSSPPGLSSPQPPWPWDTNRMSLLFKCWLKGAYFRQCHYPKLLIGSIRRTVRYLSVSDVERLSQLGKVFIDVNRLQPPTISSQTFVERNGVALREKTRTKLAEKGQQGNTWSFLEI